LNEVAAFEHETRSAMERLSCQLTITGKFATQPQMSCRGVVAAFPDADPYFRACSAGDMKSRKSLVTNAVT
jgi:hypothetical protein